MKNLIEYYITETPRYIDKTIYNYDKSKTNFRNTDKIYLVGSGSSYNAAKQICDMFQKISSKQINVLYPFECKQTLFYDAKHTLVIGISQSGASVSTYNAMAYAKQKGCNLASLTAQPNTYIEELTNNNIYLDIPFEKAGPKTLGYTLTKLKLLMMAYQIANKNLTSDFYSLSDEYIKEIQEAKKWVNTYINEFKSAKDVRIIGSAEIYGDTLESALKILETLRIHVTGYEYDEFIHGIYNSVNDDTYLIFLDDGQLSNLDRIIKILQQWTTHIFVIKRNIINEIQHNFIFPVTPEYLSAKVPFLKGYDAARPKDPNFHKEMESKKGEY